MGTRIMRRMSLQKGKGKVDPKGKENEESDEDTPAPVKTNLFKHLQTQSSSEDEADISDEKLSDESAQSLKKKKPKRKKNKKKARKSQNLNLDEAGPSSSLENVQPQNPSTSANELELQERENDDNKLNKDFKQMLANTDPILMSCEIPDIPDLFKIQNKYLDFHYEMTRMFTASVVGPKKLSAADLLRYKSRIFSPTNDMIEKRQQIGTGGLGMDLISVDDGIHIFKYTHNEKYRSAHENFCAVSLVPLLIPKVFEDYPFHVDTIVVLSTQAKNASNFQSRNTFVELALFYLESVRHHQLKYDKGNCRLPYFYYENRIFHITLFYYIISVDERAAHRTALECAKLMLSLDPMDPCGIIFCIDGLALAAKEYAWLIAAFHEWSEERNAHLLPNMLMSYAYAVFKHKKSRKEDTAIADMLLQDALIKVPGMFAALMSKIKPGVWKPALCDKFFTDPHGKSVPLEKLLKAYAFRFAYLWKNAEILTWLENNALIVLERVKSEKKSVDVAKKANTMMKYFSAPLLRYLYLYDCSEAKLETLDNTPIPPTDPFPPSDGLDPYANRSSNRDQHLIRRLGHGPLGSLLRSLVPMYGAGDQNDNQFI